MEDRAPLRSPERSATTRAPLADLGLLYAEQADFVRRVVLRLGGPTIDAEDLVQEVFLVALRRAADFEGRSLPRTWLYGIAARIVSSARRRARLRRMLGLDEVPEPIDGRTPGTDLERAEASRLVYRALDRLAEKKRTVFILYEIEGLAGEEIARLVECPLKTVWTRLFHARKEFLREIQRTQGDAPAACVGEASDDSGKEGP